MRKNRRDWSFSETFTGKNKSVKIDLPGGEKGLSENHFKDLFILYNLADFIGITVCLSVCI